MQGTQRKWTKRSARMKQAMRALWSDRGCCCMPMRTFPILRSRNLRRLGHDVLTTQEDGLAGTADPGILARAYSLSRSVLTYNRRHFERLHDKAPHIAAFYRPRTIVISCNSLPVFMQS